MNMKNVTGEIQHQHIKLLNINHSRTLVVQTTELSAAAATFLQDDVENLDDLFEIAFKNLANIPISNRFGRYQPFFLKMQSIFFNQCHN